MKEAIRQERYLLKPKSKITLPLDREFANFIVFYPYAEKSYMLFLNAEANESEIICTNNDEIDEHEVRILWFNVKLPGYLWPEVWQVLWICRLML